MKCIEMWKAARKDKAKWLKDQRKDIERFHGKIKTREMHKLVRNVNSKWKPKLMAIENEAGRTIMNK